MTFREKLKQEHPENINAHYAGGCLGCPYDYDYEETPPSFHNKCRTHEQLGSCAACWDREMPEVKEDADCRVAEAPRNDGGEVDMVNHPPHYTSGGIECIDAIAAALSVHKDPMSAWLTGQILKYCWRFPLKNGVEDLKKARFYLDRLIQREEKK